MASAGLTASPARRRSRPRTAARNIICAGSRSTSNGHGGFRKPEPSIATVVDPGAAEAYLFDRDRIADGMRVIVAPKTSTPMIAVIMRNAKANPYWHVPPELVRSLTAKRISKEGSPT